MPNEKPCPCGTCPTRKHYAKAWDFHIWGEDCPYVCPRYDKWKEEREKENAAD